MTASRAPSAGGRGTVAPTQRRGLARSVRLFRAFLVEQTEPERFYGALAQDSVEMLAELMPLRDARVLDVGACPAEFARAFRAAGAHYVPVDRDPGVESVRAGGVVADAGRLPFGDGEWDLVFSSNLWEHVPDPEAVADELLRVVRPGGLLFLSYTNWLSPWGGHETSPWHWLGGERAVRRYHRRHGHPPKNRVGVTLHRISAGRGLRWARSTAAGDLVVARPRYYPDAATPLLRLPGLREVLTWNLLLVLRRR